MGPAVAVDDRNHGSGKVDLFHVVRDGRGIGAGRKGSRGLRVIHGEEVIRGIDLTGELIAIQERNFRKGNPILPCATELEFQLFPSRSHQFKFICAGGVSDLNPYGKGCVSWGAERDRWCFGGVQAIEDGPGFLGCTRLLELNGDGGVKGIHRNFSIGRVCPFLTTPMRKIRRRKMRCLPIGQDSDSIGIQIRHHIFTCGNGRKFKLRRPRNLRIPIPRMVIKPSMTGQFQILHMDRHEILPRGRGTATTGEADQGKKAQGNSI